jgi:hypothetical protein
VRSCCLNRTIDRHRLDGRGVSWLASIDEAFWLPVHGTLVAMECIHRKNPTMAREPVTRAAEKSFCLFCRPRLLPSPPAGERARVRGRRADRLVLSSSHYPSFARPSVSQVIPKNRSQKVDCDTIYSVALNRRCALAAARTNSKQSSLSPFFSSPQFNKPLHRD